MKIKDLPKMWIKDEYIRLNKQLKESEKHSNDWGNVSTFGKYFEFRKELVDVAKKYI